MFAGFDRARVRLVGVTVGLACAAGLVAGCGSSSSGSTSSTAAGSTASTPSTTAAASQTATYDALYAGTETPPPTTGPPPAKGKTVWWISCGQAAPACSVPAAAAAEAAKAMGLDFRIADGKLNVSGGYAAAIRTAVAAKPDAIVVHAMDCAVVKQALSEAKAAGVKSMDVEAAPCAPADDEYTAHMRYSSKAPTGTDWFENWGRLSAAYIAADDPQAKVLDNSMTNDLGKLLERGFTQQLSKCSGCSIAKTVKYDISDFTPNGPWISAFRPAVLQSDASATLMPFGIMMVGLGGVKAVQESGKQMLIVGGNGESDAMDSVRSGAVAACTGCHDSSWMGYAAMDNINRVLNGQPTVPEGIGQRAVNKAHLADVTSGPGSAYHSPIDWKAAYLKLWNAQG